MKFNRKKKAKIEVQAKDKKKISYSMIKDSIIEMRRRLNRK